MDASATGLLQSLPLPQRIEVTNELDELFGSLAGTLEELRHLLYDLERLLDETFHGKDR